MICSKCGAENRDSSILCSKCGAQLKRSKGLGADRVASKQQAAERTAILAKGGITSDTRKGSPGITLCPDGIYRWVCVHSLQLTGTQILIALGFVVGFYLWFCKYMFVVDSALVHVFFFIFFMLTPFFIFLSDMRCFLYEMNDKGIICTKFRRFVESDKVMKAIASFVDLAAGNFQTAAAGILAHAEASLSFSFSTVQSVSVRADYIDRTPYILVEGDSGANKIYTGKEDFDFVLNFIKEHVSAEAARNI